LNLRKAVTPVLIVLILTGSVIFSFLEIPEFLGKLHLEKGRSLAAQTNYSQALSEYTIASKVNIPIKIAADTEIALILFDQGKYEEAIEECTSVIDLDQNNYYPYAIRASSYNAVKLPDKALDDINKSIDLNSYYGYAYAIRASIRITMKKTAGDYLQILNDCTEALQLNPTLALAYKTRGDVYLMAGQIDAAELDQAITAYDQALTLDPANNVSCYYGRGMAEFKKGDKDSALTDLNKYIDLGNDADLIKNAKQVIEQINNQYNGGPPQLSIL